MDVILDKYTDAQPEVLHPCAVCGRKFNLRSLEKHVKICERTATKKRKPFDSAKQRIQGTELAEFLPKQQQQQHQSHHYGAESRRPSGPNAHSGAGAGGGAGGHNTEERACRRPSNAWKQTRDEFLRAIRAARGDNPARAQQQQQQQHGSPHAQSHSSQQSNCGSGSPAAAQRPSTLSLVTASGAPTRSNEKGQCPTCQRQFGLKSYDRHVAFCRERATRLPASPQTRDSVAKERLEARMKYRAPALKNRRPTNREKYSPGAKVVQSPLLARSPMKEANAGSSATNATNATNATAPTTNSGTTKSTDNTASPKLPVLNKRTSQTTKESPAATSGPLKSRPMDRSNSGASKDYDPFLLAEQQLNDLFSDTSDQSSTDGSSICPSQKKPNSSPSFPLSHSSAFAKYPNPPKAQTCPPSGDRAAPQRRLSVIAPPSGFDDLTSSDLSSDCTETNSLSRELFASSASSLQASQRGHNGSEPRELGRRLIIDPNQALGGGEFAPSCEAGQPKLQNGSGGFGSRSARPAVPVRSNSLRSAVPKPPERKISSSSSSGSSDFARSTTAPGAARPGLTPQQRSAANNGKSANGSGCKALGNGSSLSLSSIISDAEMKRSNSLFDELLSSFEEDAIDSSSTLPSLMSLMRNDTSLSLLSSSTLHTQQSLTPQQSQQQQQSNGPSANGHHARAAPNSNGRINCSDDDAELSSPESVKRQECGKLSADSAYSSLNRKYSTHGRSSNDLNGSCKYKLSKFCHECGFKFPDSAKFCCECGVKRLTL